MKDVVRASCTHQRVIYRPVGGNAEGWTPVWVCEQCCAEFVPESQVNMAFRAALSSPPPVAPEPALSQAEREQISREDAAATPEPPAESCEVRSWPSKTLHIDRRGQSWYPEWQAKCSCPGAVIVTGITQTDAKREATARCKRGQVQQIKDAIESTRGP